MTGDIRYVMYSHRPPGQKKSEEAFYRSRSIAYVGDTTLPFAESIVETHAERLSIWRKLFVVEPAPDLANLAQLKEKYGFDLT